MRSFALTLGAWLLTATVGMAADDFASMRDYNWHQFRGPQANGVAPHGNPPVTWDEQTNIKWKLEVPGDSTATPIIWGNDVFITTAIKTDREGVTELPPRPFSDAEQQRIRAMSIKPPQHYYQFVVMGLDRATGKIKWQHMAKEAVPHEGVHPDGSYAAATPITDGQNLYVSFGSRGVYCYDLAGKQKWARDLGRMDIFSTFGESISPILHGDTLVVNWDHETGSFMVALDARTGATRWKVERDEKTTWATPLAVDYDGRTQVIAYGKNRIRSYDLKNGELIWECHGNFTACIPCPVQYGNLVLVMTGFQGYELLAIPLDAKGDITDTDKIAWKKNQGTPYCPSALVYGDLLYITQENKGILSVVNPKTGEDYINRQRLEGINNIYASPVGAADHVYLTGRDGVTVVLKKSPTLEILATNKLDDRIDASGAIVGKELFLRGRKTLYCISSP